MRICTSTQFGIEADAKEAVAFAILAHETWRHKPASLPSATGATHAVVLGNLTP
jgi:anhydro-N-acetylmuramic acid kinase